MKCSIMLHFIWVFTVCIMLHFFWVFTVCKSTCLGVFRIQRVTKKIKINIFSPNLVKFIFPLPVTIFPPRDPGILWGLYAIVKFKNLDNMYLSYIKNSLASSQKLSPVHQYFSHRNKACAIFTCSTPLCC